MIKDFSVHVSQGGTIFTARDAITLLLRLSGTPFDLLTDISLNCNEEVLNVCEEIREELSNRENKTSEVRGTGFIKPSLFSREFNQEVASKDETTCKRYIDATKEWINE